MVSLRSNEKIIGATSCRIQDELAGFGYCIHRDYWYQGLATEAAGAIVEWVVSLPRIRRIWATCDFENERSMRVLEKMGLTREKRLRHYSVRPNISMKLRDAFLYSKKIYRN
jgi:RimJ/RimL family protein N-acetyltransferase